MMGRWSVVVLLLTLIPSTEATCVNDAECEALVGEGSVCLGDACTNPLQKGCLYSRLKQDPNRPLRLRTCNSEDPLDAADRGICSPSQIPSVLEVRVSSQNWESALLEAWLLQVILSELLDVPVTSETGNPEVDLNFYQPTYPFLDGRLKSVQDDLGQAVAYDFEGLNRSSQVGDCRSIPSFHPETDSYQSCCHIMLEQWGGRTPWIQSLTEQRIIDPPQALGVVGTGGWYVPKFVAERHPEVLSNFGLQGEANRRKLAEMFLTPTTWGDYCDLISQDNCKTDDGVSKRAPLSDTESDRMFVHGLYQGYFRNTTESDCGVNAETCTGHIADWPCG